METFQKQENLQAYFEKSYACVVFGSIAKAGFGLGVAGGKGDVYLLLTPNQPQRIGEATMMQASLGFQFGGQVYSEIIFLETAKDLEDFKAGHLEFEADANAVALTASASAKASTLGNQGPQLGWTPDDMTMGATTPEFRKGTAIFTLPLGGLMYQATVAGQKFQYKDLEETATN